jgi:pseudoazurin
MLTPNMESIMRYAVLLATLLVFTGTASAAEVNVSMLNKPTQGSGSFVFEPAVVTIKPGDTVKWSAKTPGHNVEFVKGAVPEKAELFRSPLGKDAAHTFSVPGIYVYKCAPHYGMGMVGVIIVGDKPANLKAVEAFKFPGKAQAAVTAALAQIKR